MEVLELSTENILDLDRKNRKKIYQMGAVTEAKVWTECGRICLEERKRVRCNNRHEAFMLGTFVS